MAIKNISACIRELGRLKLKKTLMAINTYLHVCGD